METSLTLLDLLKRIGALVMSASTQGVWITAELSDVAVRGGHCYMELLQKDPATSQTVARARGTIWASTYGRLATEFMAATGQQFATGIKVMLRVSAQMHPVFGLSLNISAVNPDYTMGDLLRRRREILARLKADGILEDNRRLQWPDVPQRIAVISAPGAAGFGDFVHQLYNNAGRLRFTARLFPAVMQGEKTVRSIISALEVINNELDQWDGVVIIRGGGATSDLQAFDDYDLAATIAQFPIPVIVGIGHERDITVLDYVANMRVKTPTAAAEWLIGRGEEALGRLQEMANNIHRYVTDRIGGMKMQLTQYETILPTLPAAAIERASARIERAMMAVTQVGTRHIMPRQMQLNHYTSTLVTAISNVIERRATRLSAFEEMLAALSPQAVLKRGFTITRCQGSTVRRAADVPPGTTITTITADGTIESTTR